MGDQHRLAEARGDRRGGVADMDHERSPGGRPWRAFGREFFSASSGRLICAFGNSRLSSQRSVVESNANLAQILFMIVIRSGKVGMPKNGCPRCDFEYNNSAMKGKALVRRRIDGQ